VSLAEQPLVGSDTARAVHGHSAGADAVLLPPVAVPGIADALRGLGLEPETLDGPGWLAALADAAEAAERDADPEPGVGPGAALVVASGSLDVTAVALLDLLDRPGDPTAVATVEREALDGDDTGLTVLRVEREQRRVHSVGTTRHTVTRPTSYALGVLRVSASKRGEAARLWREAAATRSAADPTIDPFDLALLVLVRGGLDIGAVALGPFSFTRGSAHSTGAPGSPWQQRLAGASRGGDGFFSTYVVRPLSRRLTGFGLARGWTPNVVTVSSLAVGLLASGLAAVDDHWAWVAAAVLLQLALVVDCVDGEIARFTRRFSALGAWLDAVGDRVKEYSLIAAVASVAVRRGESMWLLATVAMVLITMRHLEDYAYYHRNRSTRLTMVADQLAVDEPRDLGGPDARTTVPAPRHGRAEVVYWVKKVLHLPIAERYLLLSIGLVTFNARLLLWTITIAVAIALVWTQGGRTAKALLGVDGFRRDRGLSPGQWGHLDFQVDLGPLARFAGRVVALPFSAAIAGSVLVGGAATIVAATRETSWLVVALVVAGAVLVGAGCRPPLQDRLGWQASSLLWGAEAALVLALVNPLPESAEWCGYVYLAAVAWHRYDVVYRLRDTGRPAAAWVTAVTLGVDGRWVALALVAALGGPLQAVLVWGAVAMFLVYAVESARGWRAWAHDESRGDDDEADSEVEV
jgi:phosphatidylglycerophosphate synthase